MKGLVCVLGGGDTHMTICCEGQISRHKKGHPAQTKSLEGWDIGPGTLARDRDRSRKKIPNTRARVRSLAVFMSSL